MRILGIDPGLAIVGYGIIASNGQRHSPVAYGAILTPAKTSLPSRISTIYQGICELIETYKPTAVAIEELFFNTNTTTAFAVAQARGVMLLAAVNAGVALYEYTPLQVKQAVVGYGRAEKAQVQQMVKMLLNLQEIPKPDDVADALAVALCHAHSAKMNDYLGIGKV
ncbi:MAG: crossover junction endodeoxyribonuclease RuvC [Hyphomonadaceae bacterium]|nr:crossover junction endodeoxyribonuclease RuvC [Clostridia bacterium]